MSTAKLEHEVEEMMKSVDKKYLRPMQKQAYLCSAGCFDKGYGTKAVPTA